MIPKLEGGGGGKSWGEKRKGKKEKKRGKEPRGEPIESVVVAVRGKYTLANCGQKGKKVFPPGRKRKGGLRKIRIVSKEKKDACTE